MPGVLSIDIGIKNLAYCYLDKECNIGVWGVINIIEVPELEVTKCQILNKTGKNKGGECGKTSVYKGFDKFMCKKHSKSCDDPDILKINKVNTRKVKDYTLLELGVLLVEKLDEVLPELMEEFDPDTVVIELQPRFNPKMKNMSMMVYNYLIIRFMVDTKRLTAVKFISAKKKLTVYDGPLVECKLKDKYARTKYLGIKYCEYLITEDTHNLGFFLGHKKKDDLADSYLQGLWYSRNASNVRARKLK